MRNASRTNSLVLAGLLAAASSALGPAAHAAITNWTNNAGGTFTTPTNWDNGVPDADDTAVFNRGAGVAYHVTFPGGNIFDPPINHVIDALRVHSNTVTFRDNSSPFITKPSVTFDNADSIVVGQNAGDLAILNTSLNSLVGTHASIGRLAGSDGTVNVTAGSFSISSGILNVGQAGTGRLNVINGASALSLVARIGDSVGSTGIATISGTDSILASGLDMLVGTAGTGTLRIEAGGRVTNTVGNVGSAVGSTGTATVTGAGSTWFNSNILSVGAAGTGTLIVENGGDVSSLDGYIGHLAGSNGTVTVRGSGSTWTNATELFVGQFGTGTLTVQDGAAVTSRFGRIGIQTGSSGTVTVRGSGSAWTISELLNVGTGGTGTLTIEDGGSLSNELGFVGTRHVSSTATAIATVRGAGSTWTSTLLEVGYGDRKGTLIVEDGGRVSNVNIRIGSGTSAHGTVTVRGTGASWNTSGSMYVGGQELIAGSAGSLNVETGSTVNIGQDLVLWGPGTVNLRGGQITLTSWENLIFLGGRFDFGLGTLEFTTSQAIGFGELIEKTLSGERRLRVGQHLEIDGTLTLNAPFQIDGGHLESDSLAVNSGLAFTAGVLEVRNGSITGITNLVVPASGELRTKGVHSFRVTGLAGSTITATGNLTLGDATKVNGFYTSGTIDVGANNVALADANDAVLDSGALASLGKAGSAGALSAPNGLTLNFGGNITGFGTVNTPNDPFRPLINNGHVIGNSAAQPITLAGFIKGVGTLNHVSVTGTLAPGFSPASLYVGSVNYLGALEIEIGGASPGSFDRVIHSGAADLGGTLQVSLINDFSPTHGQRFDILTADPVEGRFDTHTGMRIGMLPNGKIRFFDPQYTSAALSLVYYEALPGDANFDGQVNIADYLRIDRGFARDLHGWANGDFDHNALIDGADFFIIDNAYLSRFNPSPASAVPEPSAVALFLPAILALLRRQRRLPTSPP